MHESSETPNIEQALRILRRRVLLITLCIVVVAGAAFGYSKHQTQKYTATASLAFSSNQISQQVLGLEPTSGNPAAEQASNIELVKLGDMATKTAALLGHGLTTDKVAASVSVTGEGESSIVDVTASATSPTLAAAIANTYSTQFVKEQRNANHQYFSSALALVNTQLTRLTPIQRLGDDGLSLQDRAQTLGLLEGLDYGSAQVAQEALAPISPSSPKTSRNTMLGLLLGLLIGLGLAFVLERLDSRVRGAEDLEAIYGLPLLGVVPESSALAASPSRGDNERVALPPAEAEAFSLIRAHLRFFNVDRELRTILIASPAPGDGKTTIARHLAAAAARLGSRVLLLEADLRHPTLAQPLGIQAGPGLAEVLIGAIPMGEATHRVDLEASLGEGVNGRTLDVLTASAVPPPTRPSCLRAALCTTYSSKPSPNTTSSS